MEEINVMRNSRHNDSNRSYSAVLWLAKMGFYAESVFFRGQQYIIIHIWFFQLVKGQRILLTLFTPLVIFFPTKCTPVLRWAENFVNLRVIRRIGAVCFDRFSFSGRGRVTSCSGEFFGILCGSESSLLNAVFLYCKHRKVRIKQEHHPYSRQGANFTSDRKERLHK